MPKYLVEASYTSEGAKGLLKEGGSSRRAAVEQAIKALGGTLEAFYFAYGDADVIVIADMPDDASCTAVALTIRASGTVKLKTTVLITPETVDEAVKKSVGYRAPGQ